MRLNQSFIFSKGPRIASWNQPLLRKKKTKTRNPLDGKISKNEGVCYFFQSNSNNRLTLLLQSKFLGVLTLPTNQIRVSKSLWTLQISRKI